MTYRDRRMAKAERLRGWAEKRQTRAAVTLAQGEPYRHDWAFITQPGHIPQRARMIASDERTYESLAKAANMRSRADGIEAQAAGAIYSDDPDVVERLRERIAELEAERDRVKAYNASCRKGSPDPSFLTERQRSGLETAERFQGDYQERRKHQLPPYVLSNLSGNIARQRERLAQLERVG
jgi:hypothetical protein